MFGGSLSKVKLVIEMSSSWWFREKHTLGRWYWIQCVIYTMYRPLCILRKRTWVASFKVEIFIRKSAWPPGRINWMNRPDKQFGSAYYNLKFNHSRRHVICQEEEEEEKEEDHCPCWLRVGPLDRTFFWIQYFQRKPDGASALNPAPSPRHQRVLWVT